jgi:guanylate kinase
MSGTPFIVSAPSGSGKTTLCRMLTKNFPDMRNSVSYTTRVRREGEEDGVDYRFIDKAEFARMAAAGEFIEHAEVFGKKYGTSGDDIERLLGGGLNVLLEIDVQGATKIRSALESGVYIFILPPSIEACKERLVARGKNTPEEIERRLRIAIGEIAHAPEYDYIIINDDLGAAFTVLKSIVDAETGNVGARELAGGARKEVMMARVKEIFG